jgi:hypothetical protein
MLVLWIVTCRQIPTFRRNILPPALGPYTKLRFIHVKTIFPATLQNTRFLYCTFVLPRHFENQPQAFVVLGFSLNAFNYCDTRNIQPNQHSCAYKITWYKDRNFALSRLLTTGHNRENGRLVERRSATGKLRLKGSW